MKRFNPGLLPRIIIAIAAGIGAGYVFPVWLTRFFVTFNAVFSQFLGFLIPLLIVGFVAPAIADIGRKAGKMLVVTALIAYVMTFCTGMLSYFTSAVTFPGLLGDTYIDPVKTAVVDVPMPFFTVEIPPMFSVMTALVLAFVLGLGVSRLAGIALKSVLDDFRGVIQWTITRIIIPCLPIYIFGIFLGMTVSGQVGPVLVTFSKIIIVIFVMHVAVLVLQYMVAALFSGFNPFKSLWTMMPAYFTALGTQSSAATIPVTLRQTVAMGVDKDVAGFVVPLCATIHMSGSTLKIVACALALMITHHMPYDAGMFAGFISMLAITIIAAPGVPGGAIMASLGLLSSMLGFSEADNALMIALYIAMDSFGTACNITGDGAIAQIVGRIFSSRPAQANYGTAVLVKDNE
ncbi:MAG: dicarboxylate/amino acid:cation symporter [Muribaculaceae bacterium]|nr:dicarboxylate/amino acid:cation symporter [Muribaculaceae bacterium]